jgi:spore coat protein U-like protein
VNKSHLLRSLPALVAAAWCLSAGTANALTATGNITVSATVASFCTISASTLAFGSVNAGVAVTNNANTFTLTCNKGVTFTSLLMNNGLQPSGIINQMAFGAERLQYFIDIPTGALLNTCPVAGSNEWGATGPASGAVTALFAVTGGAKAITLCGSIPAGQFPASGAYADTVVTTATYN